MAADAAPAPVEPVRQADGLLPPGTALDISSQTPTPGENFGFQMCTAAYSFFGPDGTPYAVTASHCGQVGDSVWAGQESTEFRYPADPIGTVVFSELHSEGSQGVDVALIELADAAHTAELYAPEPLAASTNASAALPEEVCKVGRMTGRTCGPVTHDVALGILRAGETQWETNAARAAVCARTGDSGGPVFVPGEQGAVIVGLVSGTDSALAESETCDTEAVPELSFVPIADVQRVIDAFLAG